MESRLCVVKTREELSFGSDLLAREYGMGVRTFFGGARSWDEQTANFDVDPKLLLQLVLLVSRPAHTPRRQSLCS